MKVFFLSKKLGSKSCAKIKAPTVLNASVYGTLAKLQLSVIIKGDLVKKGKS